MQGWEWKLQAGDGALWLVAWEEMVPSFPGLFQTEDPGTSLVGHWMRLHAPNPNAGGPGSIPGRELRSHKPKLSLHAVNY